MSRKGNCWDNAQGPSFFGKLKGEWLNHLGSLGTVVQAKLAVFEYLDSYYFNARRHELIVTDKLVAVVRKRDPNPTLVVTSEAEVKLIRLQRQLYAKAELMFVFVENPLVEPTNNRSEHATEPEVLARKSSRTSETDAGAKRRGIIMTVLSSLNKRLGRLTLSGVVAAVEASVQAGIALFLPIPDKPT